MQGAAVTPTRRDLDRIDRIKISWIADHRRDCCRDARWRVFAQLRHYPDLASRVAAVPDVIRWAPTRWPHYWCELTRSDELAGDCGVHAHVASDLLADAGVEHSRGRAAIAPYPMMTAHWRATWREASCDVAWICGSVVHHEVLRIRRRWWDPTEARWFEGVGARLASGRVVAVREEDGGWDVATDEETEGIDRARAVPGP